jgi:hypothetical protein
MVSVEVRIKPPYPLHNRIRQPAGLKEAARERLFCRGRSVAYDVVNNSV